MSGSIGDNVFRASGVIAAAAAGRTGTVDWDTSIHTGTVTAVSANGYFVNTTAGGVIVNLPAASVGDIVAISDYASTSATNNITVTPNGSEKINGHNDDYTIETAGLAVTLVYADATRGWKSVTGSDADATGVTPLYVTATGGNQPAAPAGCIVCTNYKVHRFTGPGAFCVSCAGNADGSNTVDYLVVAGGGGGGKDGGGAGGGGGYRESPGAAAGCYCVSPRGVAPAAAIAVSATPYAITVGAGGAGSTNSSCKGVSGLESVFTTITSAGGGGGGSYQPPVNNGAVGGSGGGARSKPGTCGGAGDTPPAPVAQGTDGGDGVTPIDFRGGGGGGATAAGGPNSPHSPPTPHSIAGVGGVGATTCITASPVGYAGGGGGGGNSPCGGGDGSPCGAGRGGQGPCVGSAGAVNRGGGGGGGSGTAFAGGSGVVVIRYKFQ